MKLVMLGTNGAQPTDDGQTACYMIPELGIILDAGSGLYRIPRYLETDILDIYISHAHTDHTLGLGYLFVALMEKSILDLGITPSDDNMEVVDKRSDEAIKRMRIHAAEPTLTEIRNTNYFLMADAQWLPLDEEENLPGDGTITRFELKHTGICHGFRLEWPGRSLAYVTDTTAKAGAPYVDTIRGVDVLLHEAYLPTRLAQFAADCGHSVTMPVAQVAAEAEVGRLILIHHNTLGMRVGGEELESAREIFPATDVGLDGMEVEF